MNYLFLYLLIGVLLASIIILVYADSYNDLDEDDGWYPIGVTVAAWPVVLFTLCVVGWAKCLIYIKQQVLAMLRRIGK